MKKTIPVVFALLANCATGTSDSSEIDASINRVNQSDNGLYVKVDIENNSGGNSCVPYLGATLVSLVNHMEISASTPPKSLAPNFGKSIPCFGILVSEIKAVGFWFDAKNHTEYETFYVKIVIVDASSRAFDPDDVTYLDLNLKLNTTVAETQLWSLREKVP